MTCKSFRPLVPIAILLLAASCGTAKQTSSRSTAAETSHSGTATTVATTTAVVEERLGADRSEEINGIVIIYDTDKPVVEHTGKPPVKEERIVQYAARIAESGITVSGSSSEEIAVTATDDRTTENTVVQEAQQKKGPGFLVQLRNVLLSVAIAAAIAILYVIAKKYGLLKL